MDATNNTDSVVNQVLPKPSPKTKPKKPKIPIKMEDQTKTNADNADQGLSGVPQPDVAGQMYLWDVSEEPNVVMRQSQLEYFLYDILTHEDGVPANIYQAIVGSLMVHVSPRFQRSVFFYMERFDKVYKFNPPKPTAPAYQEIWS